MSRVMLSRVIGVSAVVLFVATEFTPMPDLLAERLEVPSELAPADAIVVLAGGGVSPSGELSSISLHRTVRGIVLYQRRLAPLLVLSGGRGGESESRAALAREIGVPGNAILSASVGDTTHEEAVRVGALLKARGVRKVLLVTDQLHMVRARQLFEREEIEVLAAPVPQPGGNPEERYQLLRRILQERLALLYYRVSGYL